MVFITKLIYRRNLPPLKEMLLWNNNLCVTTSNSGIYIVIEPGTNTGIKININYPTMLV